MGDNLPLSVEIIIHVSQVLLLYLSPFINEDEGILPKLQLHYKCVYY